MAETDPPSAADPIHDRVDALDVVRGLALFGVLMVNLCTEFRVSLFDWLAHFDVGPTGPVSRAVAFGLAVLVEEKAFSVFSLLFGVGLAAQSERRGAGFRWFAARRLGVLLLLGLAHLTLIWDGDILVEYAVAGAIVTPLLALEDTALLAIAVLLLAIHLAPLPFLGTFPGDDHVAASIVGYRGSWLDALWFRLHELQYILPLHLNILPRTLGLLALGAWTWRVGLWRGAHRSAVVGVAAVGVPLGLLTTTIVVWRATLNLDNGSVVPDLATVATALGYAAAAYLGAGTLRALAPLGRMALTSYLTQSLVWSFLFYGWGLGLYYRLDAATTLGMGVVLYGLQVAASALWLRHFRFGPVEWAWRCATYGRWLPLR